MQSSSNQHLDTFTGLPKEERKSLLSAFAKVVAADDEADRLHDAYPELKDKLRVVSYDLIFDASASGGSFETNKGKEYKSEYEIATTNNGPQNLTLDVTYWSVEGNYGSGAIGEDWTTIKAAYRGNTRCFDSDSYDDPGNSWEVVEHGNLKSVFRQVADDVGLLTGNVDEDSVLGPMLTAFLGDNICKRRLVNGPNPLEGGRNVLEVILMELQWCENA